MEYLPNKLTPFNFKIYYKEENHLKAKTALFIYPSPPYSKGLGILEYWYISILYFYISIYLYTKFYYIT